MDPFIIQFAGVEDVNHELIGGIYTQMLWVRGLNTAPIKHPINLSPSNNPQWRDYFCWNIEGSTAHI